MTDQLKPGGFRYALLWLGSTTLIWQIWSWVFTLLTARLLLPSDYGLMALAETALPYLAIITNLGLSTWVVQRPLLEREQQESAFLLSLILAVLGTIIVYVLAPYLASFYETPRLATILRLLAPVFLCQGLLAVPKSLMRRKMRFKTLGLMNLWLAVLRSVLQLSLAYLGFGYMALVVGLLAVEVADAALALKLEPVRLRLRLPAGLLREMVRFGLPVTGAAVCQIVFSTTDNLVVGKLLGAETLGFYAMAFYLTDLPMAKLNMVLRPVMLSHFSRLQHSVSALRTEFLKIMSGALFATMPVLTGLLLISPEAVPLFLGPRWLPMVPAVQVLCVVGLLRAFIDNLSPLLLALGRPRCELQIKLLAVVILAPAFYLLALRFGLAGIYMTWLGLFPVVILIALKITAAATGIDVRDFLAAAARPALATACMTLAVLAAGRFVSIESAVLTMTWKIAMAVPVYLIAAWLLAPRELLEAVFSRPGRISNLSSELPPAKHFSPVEKAIG